MVSGWQVRNQPVCQGSAPGPDPWLRTGGEERGREGGQAGEELGKRHCERALVQAGPGCGLQEGLVPGATSTDTGTEE